MMTLLTLPVSPTHFDMCVIFSNEELERIKAYDPAQIDFTKIATVQGLLPRAINIFFATDEELAEMKAGGVQKLPVMLEKLARGFKFRPEVGDHDHGPVPDGNN